MQPEALPSGIPIETIVSGSAPRIVIGSQSYSMGGGGSAPWVQMVVLDRQTLAPGGSPSTYAGGTGGVMQLADDIEELDSDDLVIISGWGSGTADSPVVLETTLRSIGFSYDPGAAASVAQGDFSVVGVPGIPPGTAHQVVGQSQRGSSPPGGMQGFLQTDVNGNFAFTWPPRDLTFDTHADSSSDRQNVMSVSTASNPIASDQVSGGPAFHLVWLDALTGAVLGNRTFPTTVEGMADFANRLAIISGDDGRETILVQSIGAPNASSADSQSWAAAASGIQEYGANRYVFAGLDGKGGYSFIGAEGLPFTDGLNAGEELAQAIAGSPSARLSGLLRPNDQGTLTGAVNVTQPPGTPSAQVLPALDPLLTEPAEPFDYDFSSTGLKQQAIADAQAFLVSRSCDPNVTPKQAVCGGLDLGGVVDTTFGIRSLYWTNNQNWGKLQSSISDIDPAQGLGCDSDCQLAVKTLRGDFVQPGDSFRGLEEEFGLVDDVSDYFKSGSSEYLYGALTAAGSESSDFFTAVALQILKQYDQPAAKPEGVDGLKITEDVMSIARSAAAPVPVAGGAISAAFGISGGTLSLIQDLNTTPGGIPAYDPAAFESDFSTWGTEVVGEYNDSLASLDKAFDLLVSDQGRLGDAAAMVTTQGGGGWELSDEDSSALPTAVANTAAQFMWTTMLPVPVVAVLCPPAQNLGTAATDPAALVSLVSEGGPALEQEMLFLVDTTGRTPEILDKQTAGVLFSQIQSPASGQPNLAALGFRKPYFMSGQVGGPDPSGSGGFDYAALNSSTRTFFEVGSPPICLAGP